MHHFWHKVEDINSRLIPLALVLLLFIIIFELFIHTENHAVELTVHILDYIVITIFVIDLIFLAIKARTTGIFLKRYWLDILAVFPFGLMFGMVERFYRSISATERVVVGQAIFHETLEARKELRFLARSERALKVMRIGARSLRFITKSRFFTNFHHKQKKR